MNLTCWGFLIWMECQASPQPPPIVACPQIQQWTKDYQSRLADELERLPPNAAIGQVMREHLQLRDRIRKCRKS